MDKKDESNQEMLFRGVSKIPTSRTSIGLAEMDFVECGRGDFPPTYEIHCGDIQRLLLPDRKTKKEQADEKAARAR